MLFRRSSAALVALAMLVGTVSACSDDDGGAADPGPDRGSGGLLSTDLVVEVDPDEPTAPSEFDVRPGTEEVTVTGVEPEQRLSLVDADGRRMVVLHADKYGQAHFSYLPDELAEFKTGARAKLPTDQGYVVPAGKGYTIRKLRYEAVPGLWIGALLYEPENLTGKVPVVLNPNGHVGKPGMTIDYKQARCINLAKRGMLALNYEWIGMGQLGSPGYGHGNASHLDLCGRAGLSVFFHNNPWCQSTTEPLRYDLGGYGTAGDPGIRWYFERVRERRRTAGCRL